MKTTSQIACVLLLIFAHQVAKGLSFFGGIGSDSYNAETMASAAPENKSFHETYDGFKTTAGASVDLVNFPEVIMPGRIFIQPAIVSHTLSGTTNPGVARFSGLDGQVGIGMGLSFFRLEASACAGIEGNLIGSRYNPKYDVKERKLDLSYGRYVSGALRFNISSRLFLEGELQYRTGSAEYSKAAQAEYKGYSSSGILGVYF